MKRLFFDLISSPSGKVSHTKLWANVAYAVASYAIIAQAYKGNLTYDMLGVYLGAVALHGGASKAIALKYGTKKEPARE